VGANHGFVALNGEAVGANGGVVGAAGRAVAFNGGKVGTVPPPWKLATGKIFGGGRFICIPRR